MSQYGPRRVAVVKIKRALERMGLDSPQREAILESLGGTSGKRVCIGRKLKRKLDEALEKDGLVGIRLSKKGHLNIIYSHDLKVTRKFFFDDPKNVAEALERRNSARVVYGSRGGRPQYEVVRIERKGAA